MMEAKTDKEICPLMNNISEMEDWIYCQGDKCAWWRKTDEQCAIATLGEALGTIAIMQDEHS